VYEYLHRFEREGRYDHALNKSAYMRVAGVRACREYEAGEGAFGGASVERQRRKNDRLHLPIIEHYNSSGTSVLSRTEPSDYMDLESADNTLAVDVIDQIAFLMDCLSPAEAEVVVMCLVLGFSAAETAGLICKSPAWATQKRWKSIVEMRRKLMDSQLWHESYRDCFPAHTEYEWMQTQMRAYAEADIRRRPLERELEDDYGHSRFSRVQEAYDSAMKHCGKRKRSNRSMAATRWRQKKKARQRKINKKTVDFTMPSEERRKEQQAIREKIKKMTG
jgi:hypothetical protein